MRRPRPSSGSWEASHRALLTLAARQDKFPASSDGHMEIAGSPRGWTRRASQAPRDASFSASQGVIADLAPNPTAVSFPTASRQKIFWPFHLAAELLRGRSRATPPSPYAVEFGGVRAGAHSSTPLKSTMERRTAANNFHKFAFIKVQLSPLHKSAAPCARRGVQGRRKSMTKDPVARGCAIKHISLRVFPIIMYEIE
jgi:hypothetical protein